MREAAEKLDLGPDLRAWTGRVGQMPRAHQHTDLEINFVLGGTMRYLIHGREWTLPQRRLCLLWAATPHRTVNIERNTELIWVTVPLPLLWRMPLGRGFFARLMARGLLVDPQPLASDEALLRQWLDDLQRADVRRLRVVKLELEARLQRLVLALGERRGAARAVPSAEPRRSASRHVQAMARFMARRLAEPITVPQIAAAAGISANHAMTLFRQHTGATLSGHLTRQRVALAQRLLTTSAAPILQVGLACGFGSVSRFYEAFRDQTGSSPAAFRRAHGRVKNAIN